MNEYTPYVYDFDLGEGWVCCFYDGEKWTETTQEHWEFLLKNGAKIPNSNINAIKMEVLSE